MNVINDTNHTISQTICDENLDPIDTSLLTGIVAKVFQKGKELDKFSFNTQSGYRTIVKVSPNASGVLEFYLNAENLRQGIDGHEVFYEIKYELANTNFDSNTEERSTGPLSLGTLQKTKLANETQA